MKRVLAHHRKMISVLFAAVIKYVDGHIGEDLRSEDVAERIGMSRSYFSTRFKEMTGKHFTNM